MSHPVASHALSFPSANHVLGSLTKEEYARLLPRLMPVRLPQGYVLWEAGEHIRHAFFPLSGMVSLLSTTGDGRTIEVGMIGREGLAGVSALLGFDSAPYKIVAQLPTPALRIKLPPLAREFALGGRLHDLLLRYTHMLLTQVAQSASCNRFHTAGERLCRLLLVSADRAGSDTLRLTQEFLSQVIGVPRTSVTAAAKRLQSEGLITYRRGRIALLDRRGLEALSCECYGLIRQGLTRYMAA